MDSIHYQLSFNKKTFERIKLGARAYKQTINEFIINCIDEKLNCVYVDDTEGKYTSVIIDDEITYPMQTTDNDFSMFYVEGETKEEMEVRIEDNLNKYKEVFDMLEDDYK